MELAERFVKQAQGMGAEIQELGEVTGLDLEAEEKHVKTRKGVYTASTLIIASGCRYRVLGIPGEKELRGKGVSYCAVCDGAFFKGRKVAVVGGGNSAAASALYLSNLASKVMLIHRRDQLRAEGALIGDLQKRGIEFLLNKEIKRIEGDAKVQCATVFDNRTGETIELEVDGVFIQIGEVPNSRFAQEAGIKVDNNGYIIVDDRQRTNIPGVYAAGDITPCPVKQVGTAVGQAILSAIEAFGYAKRPYYYRD